MTNEEKAHAVRLADEMRARGIRRLWARARHSHQTRAECEACPECGPVRPTIEDVTVTKGEG